MQIGIGLLLNCIVIFFFVLQPCNCIARERAGKKKFRKKNFKIKSNKIRQNFRKIKFSRNEIFVDKNVLNI